MTGEVTEIALRNGFAMDVGRAAAILGAAFQDDPVSSWLFPNPTVRRHRHPGFFTPFVQEALERGKIYLTDGPPDGPLGCALWLNVETNDEPETLSRETEATFMQACDLAFGRFFMLYNVLRCNYPTQTPYAHLTFIGVHPDAQGKGVGTALMRHKLTMLDRTRRPAYLECSNQRDFVFYERLGFKQLPRVINIPGGPTLYPMWREPAA